MTTTRIDALLSTLTDVVDLVSGSEFASVVESALAAALDAIHREAVNETDCDYDDGRWHLNTAAKVARLREEASR